MSHCTHPTNRVRRLHCPGATVAPLACKHDGCHLGCYCAGCEAQWLEPCRDPEHAGQATMVGSA